MPIHRYFLSDFVTIQRQSFYQLLEKGLIEEFQKRNPITNLKQDFEVLFYPEHYRLTRPEYSPSAAILKNKSYTSKLFVPVQLTDKTTKKILLKWVFIGNIPIMTKRGHFILNGAARVIVNQILRSPGIYYQQKIYENYAEKWSQKPDDTYRRYYADLICMRGTWLRIEMDKEKRIWAQTKKGPKIPIYWFLLAMGLSEKTIFKCIRDSHKLLGNLENKDLSSNSEDSEESMSASNLALAETQRTQSQFVACAPKAQGEEQSKTTKREKMDGEISDVVSLKKKKSSTKKHNYFYLKNPPEAWRELYGLISSKKLKEEKNKNTLVQQKSASEEGRKWLYNRFLNPRSYDLGKHGRLSFNKKLGLNISPNQTTLTGLDVLYATDYLIKVEKGIAKIDDIDHLKNRRVRTSGELIQIQIGVGLVRLEKSIREALNKASLARSNYLSMQNKMAFKSLSSDLKMENPNFNKTSDQMKRLKDTQLKDKTKEFSKETSQSFENLSLLMNNIMNSKAFNSAIREFFGTSPLSQFMDQINPLAELTHKRRLSSMGPGGVTRDTATLEIRGIHPTHYGRICPIETPEGKNTGLVNSMTTYARVNPNGILESPFYKVYKGQVQKNTGMYYFSAEQEEKIKLAAADLSISSIGFLPKSLIPVRITEDFTKIPRSQVQYIGVSPLQMISIAASLIPFLEHDDANRALMGSNMQRQAVPLIRPERPIVGTGLEARAVSDSGHTLIAKYSGLVTYVSAKKIVVHSFVYK